MSAQTSYSNEQPDTLEQTIHRALDAIEGLDTVTGLRNTGGRLASYLRILEIYILNHQDAPRELRLALNEARTDDARRIAHTLKGASHLLGITRIGDCAAQIESGIDHMSNQGNRTVQDMLAEIEALWPSFAHQLKSLFSSLR